MKSVSEYLHRRSSIRGLPLLAENVMDRYWNSSGFPQTRPDTGYAPVLKALFHVYNYDELSESKHPQYTNVCFRKLHTGVRISWWDLPDRLTPRGFVSKAVEAFQALQYDIECASNEHRQDLANASEEDQYAGGYYGAGSEHIFGQWDTEGFYTAFEHYANRHQWDAHSRTLFFSSWLNSAYPPDLGELPIDRCPSEYRSDQLSWIARATSSTTTRVEQFHEIGALFATHPELLSESDSRWADLLNIFSTDIPKLSEMFAKLRLGHADGQDVQDALDQFRHLHHALEAALSPYDAFSALCVLNGFSLHHTASTPDVQRCMQDLLVLFYGLTPHRYSIGMDYQCFTKRSVLDRDCAFQYVLRRVESWDILHQPLGVNIYWRNMLLHMHSYTSNPQVDNALRVAYCGFNQKLPGVHALDLYTLIAREYAHVCAQRSALPHHSRVSLQDWFVLVQGTALGALDEQQRKEGFLKMINNYLHASGDKKLFNHIPGRYWLFDFRQPAEKSMLSSQLYQDSPLDYWQHYSAFVYGPELTLLENNRAYRDTNDYFATLLSIFGRDQIEPLALPVENTLNP